MNADWSLLAKGGNNGLYVLVISLGWWAFALRDNTAVAANEEFLTAVNDVMWIFDQLLATPQMKKRTADYDTDKNMPPAKK